MVQQQEAKKGKKRLGLIIGSIVGVVVTLVIAAPVAFFFLMWFRPWGPAVAAYYNLPQYRQEYERKAQDALVAELGGKRADWKMTSYKSSYSDPHNDEYYITAKWIHVPTGVTVDYPDYQGFSPPKFNPDFTAPVYQFQEAFFGHMQDSKQGCLGVIEQSVSVNLPNKSVGISFQEYPEGDGSSYSVDTSYVTGPDTLKTPSLSDDVVLELRIEGDHTWTGSYAALHQRVAGIVADLVKQQAKAGQYDSIVVAVDWYQTEWGNSWEWFYWRPAQSATKNDFLSTYPRKNVSYDNSTHDLESSGAIDSFVSIEVKGY